VFQEEVYMSYDYNTEIPNVVAGIDGPRQRRVLRVVEPS
jgi:hypothetical protein